MVEVKEPFIAGHAALLRVPDRRTAGGTPQAAPLRLPKTRPRPHRAWPGPNEPSPRRGGGGEGPHAALQGRHGTGRGVCDPSCRATPVPAPRRAGSRRCHPPRGRGAGSPGSFLVAKKPRLPRRAGRCTRRVVGGEAEPVPSLPLRRRGATAGLGGGSAAPPRPRRPGEGAALRPRPPGAALDAGRQASLKYNLPGNNQRAAARAPELLAMQIEGGEAAPQTPHSQF